MGRADAAVARLSEVGRAAARMLADLALPIACIVCERLVPPREAGIVCGRCWLALDELPKPQCARCGHPAGVYSCRWCSLLPPYVRAARSVCWVPGGAGGAIVHALKYQGWTRVADAMGARMARLPWPADVVRERGCLVPVPLGAGRRRARGYNQSERLARAVGERWRVPVVEALTRARETESQTRLTPGDRLSNVSGAFRVRRDREVRRALAGRHVVLVDDVVTTAATLNSCAAALTEGGARIITYVTFGRARAAGDRQ